MLVHGGLRVGPWRTCSGTPTGVNKAEDRLQLAVDGAPGRLRRAGASQARGPPRQYCVGHCCSPPHAPTPTASELTLASLVIGCAAQLTGGCVAIWGKNAAKRLGTSPQAQHAGFAGNSQAFTITYRTT